MLCGEDNKGNLASNRSMITIDYDYDFLRVLSDKDGNTIKV